MLQRSTLEAKMGSASFWIANNFLLGVLIYLSALLGAHFGIQGTTLKISVVWPATGFALAEVLLFGYGVSPGVFLGNFFYNYFHLVTSEHGGVLVPLISALMISSGSLCQSLVGGCILRKFCSPNYFNTVSDVFNFIFFGGILPCLIASTVGVSTLFFSGSLKWEQMPQYWITFWVGDTFGIWIFTSLIIVWLLVPPLVRLADHLIEIGCMLLLLMLLTIVVFYFNYPLIPYYIPLCAWVAYRFQMHGATIAIFLVTLITIPLSSMGYGTAIERPEYALIILVGFLGIIVTMTLILAAVVNEREIAWRFLQRQNISLQEVLDQRGEKLEQMYQEIIIKDALASLGMMTINLTDKVKTRLGEIRESRLKAVSSLSKLNTFIESQQVQIPSTIFTRLGELSLEIANRLSKMLEFENLALKMIGHATDLTKRISSEKVVVKLINIQTLVTRSLQEVMTIKNRQHPELTVEIKKDFAWTSPMIPSIPQELMFVFKQVFEFAFDSMHIKHIRLGEDYRPSLYVRILDEKEMIALEIEMDREWHESGNQVSEELSDLEKDLLIKMPVAQDIITFLHRGQMVYESQIGHYFKVLIKLPRTLKLASL